MPTIEQLLSEAKQIRANYRMTRDAESLEKLEARYREIDLQLAELRKSRANVKTPNDSFIGELGSEAMGSQILDAKGINVKDSGSSEIGIYADDDIQVTTARIIVGKTTYALRNVTSVSIKEDVPPRSQATCGLGCIGFGLFFPALFLGLLGATNSILDDGGGFFLLLMALGGIGVGTAMLINIRGPIYNLMISSSSGEVQAFTSENRDYLEKVLVSINESIARYR